MDAVAIGGLLTGIAGMVAAAWTGWAGYQDKKAIREAAAEAQRLLRKAEDDKEKAKQEEAQKTYTFNQMQDVVSRMRKEYETDRIRVDQMHDDHMTALQEVARLTERTTRLEITIADRDQQLKELRNKYDNDMVECHQRNRELETRVKHLEQLLEDRSESDKGGRK